MHDSLQEWLRSLTTEERAEILEDFEDADSMREVFDYLRPEIDEADALESELEELEVPYNVRILKVFGDMDHEQRQEILKKLTELYAS